MRRDYRILAFSICLFLLGFAAIDATAVHWSISIPKDKGSIKAAQTIDGAGPGPAGVAGLVKIREGLTIHATEVVTPDGLDYWQQGPGFAPPGGAWTVGVLVLDFELWSGGAFKDVSEITVVP